MKVYSLDLRKKIVQSVRGGVSISETARRFCVNRSTVGRYLKRFDEESSIVPKKKSPGSPLKLDQSAMRLLEEDIESRQTRSQIRWALCWMPPSNIGRVLNVNRFPLSSTRRS
jgi:transposase